MNKNIFSFFLLTLSLAGWQVAAIGVNQITAIQFIADLHLVQATQEQGINNI
ncbi:hypothetical protein [Lutimonas sp.]|uniref:hypothetical protein n=1 Tax=Lutimonas sp. TaxID=1872403 RepID=UPI003C71EBF6